MGDEARTLGEIAQVAAFHRVQAQGVRESVHHGRDGLRSRPCSMRVRYSTLIPAREARSVRRSPGARRGA